MPSYYAHYRFGTAVLASLPADVRRSVQRFRRLYDVGLHGPDLFYYHNPLSSRGTGTLGIRYHEQTGKSFFTRVCRAIRMERSEAASAYLYGVLCHYVLDSMLHPFILQAVQDTGVSHGELETEFDRYLMELDGKLPPNGQRLTAHLRLTEGECDTVARFYPPATAKTVKSALGATVRATRLLTLPEGPARKAVETGLGLLGRELQSLLMSTKAAPRCVQLDGPLLEKYEEALQRFPDYLQQMQAHMTYNAPLEEDFERTFA